MTDYLSNFSGSSSCATDATRLVRLTAAENGSPVAVNPANVCLVTTDRLGPDLRTAIVLVNARIFVKEDFDTVIDRLRRLYDGYVTINDKDKQIFSDDSIPSEAVQTGAK